MLDSIREEMEQSEGEEGIKTYMSNLGPPLQNKEQKKKKKKQNWRTRSHAENSTQYVRLPLELDCTQVVVPLLREGRRMASDEPWCGRWRMRWGR
jgi:hypothetical protein